VVSICFNLGDCVKDLVVVAAKGLSGEWYIFVFACFPLLKATLDLPVGEHRRISKAQNLVNKYIRRNTLGSQHDWGLTHQIRSERGNPSSSSGSRTSELGHQWPCVECFSYVPVVVPMVDITQQKEETFTSESISSSLRNLPLSR
jgi:hypothetical protein